MSDCTRRAFFGRLGVAVLLPLQQAQGPLAGQGEVGTLRDPVAAGRPRARTRFRPEPAVLSPAVPGAVDGTCVAI